MDWGYFMPQKTKYMTADQRTTLQEVIEQNHCESGGQDPADILNTSLYQRNQCFLEN